MSIGSSTWVSSTVFSCDWRVRVYGFSGPFFPPETVGVLFQWQVRQAIFCRRSQGPYIRVWALPQDSGKSPFLHLPRRGLVFENLTRERVCGGVSHVSG